MDQEKIGRFIATCRKEQNLTQASLAEKLGITSKSVEKHIKRLKDEGILRRMGSRRSGNWEVIHQQK